MTAQLMLPLAQEAGGDCLWSGAGSPCQRSATVELLAVGRYCELHAARVITLADALAAVSVSDRGRRNG